MYFLILFLMMHFIGSFFITLEDLNNQGRALAVNETSKLPILEKMMYRDKNQLWTAYAWRGSNTIFFLVHQRTQMALYVEDDTLDVKLGSNYKVVLITNENTPSYKWSYLPAKRQIKHMETDRVLTAYPTLGGYVTTGRDLSLRSDSYCKMWGIEVPPVGKCTYVSIAAKLFFNSRMSFKNHQKYFYSKSIYLVIMRYSLITIYENEIKL